MGSGLASQLDPQAQQEQLGAASMRYEAQANEISIDSLVGQLRARTQAAP